MMGHLPGQGVVDRIGVGAAMGIDDALGMAGGARCVIERNRVPLVVWQRVGVVRIALSLEQVVIGQRADASPRRGLRCLRYPPPE